MRRYELDWLRVFVFSLLILYHTGMFFVPWGWHIKNNIIYEGLVWPMLFVNQWRLPILFVISGMGTYFSIRKRDSGGYALERLGRLGLPLVVGMLLVVPPQVYLERISTGAFRGSFFDFWPRHAFTGSYPDGNLSWHHLWFLPYLLFYSLVSIPLFQYLNRHPGSGLIRGLRRLTRKPPGFYWLIIPLWVWEALLMPRFPSTQAFWGDWDNLVHYLNLFLYGFLFMALKDHFWDLAARGRRLFLYGGLAATMMGGVLLTQADGVSWTSGWFAALRVFNLWSWILCLFGYATVYLKRPGKGRSYANEAVYPFYILHQTITVGIGFLIAGKDWGLGIKFLLMASGTFGICLMLYEGVIRRIHWLRPLMGLRRKPRRG